MEDTIALAQLIEKCGVSAIGVHGRRINERRGDRNRTEEIREVARSVRIPVIAKYVFQNFIIHLGLSTLFIKIFSVLLGIVSLIL